MFGRLSRQQIEQQAELMGSNATAAVRPTKAASVSANALRQAAFVERMKASGKRRVPMWLTHDEEKMIKSLLDNHQASLALEADCGVKVMPDAHYRNPESLQDFAIEEISPTLASKLVRLWHSVLPNIHPTNIQRNRRYACYAMVCSGYAFAVAVYSSPVNRHLDDGTTLELRRLAISKKCPPNSATWMMARCEKRIKNRFGEIKSIVSYQDLEKHQGTIYKAGNWTPAADVRYVPWAKTRADRAPPQSKSRKRRWHKPIR